MYKHACKTGLEGVVSKVRGGHYPTSRTNDWVKVIRRQALRIGFAPVGMAAVDLASAAFFIVNDRDARFAAAEATLIRALSMSPRHARAHMFLGAVQISTKRAAQGIRECERALALDRNLADAHGFIGCAKVLIGRGAEAEAHI